MKNKIKRSPRRAVYNIEQAYSILDKEFNCFIGFIHENHPFVIPTIYGRKDNTIYFHGSIASRMMIEIGLGIDVCLTVSIVNGLVLSKSAYNHSLNYESIMLFGKAKKVDDSEKLTALKVISDQVLKGRWEETRLPNDFELKATSVLKISIDEFSAKVRTGHPEDDQKDLELNIWSGVVPITKKYLPQISDNYSHNKPIPNSIKSLNIK